MKILNEGPSEPPSFPLLPPPSKDSASSSAFRRWGLWDRGRPGPDARMPKSCGSALWNLLQQHPTAAFDRESCERGTGLLRVNLWLGGRKCGSLLVLKEVCVWFCLFCCCSVAFPFFLFVLDWANRRQIERGQESEESSWINPTEAKFSRDWNNSEKTQENKDDFRKFRQWRRWMKWVKKKRKKDLSKRKK